MAINIRNAFNFFVFSFQQVFLILIDLSQLGERLSVCNLYSFFNQQKPEQMSLQEKIDKIAQFLPANKEIFLGSAQFQTVMEIPVSVKSKYFDDNIREIAKKFAQAVFTDKEASQIEQTDVILELEEWLSSEGVKFIFQKKQQPRNQSSVTRPEPSQQRVTEDPSVRRIPNQQSNLSQKPRPQLHQQNQNQPNNGTQANMYNHNQQRPQAYYQNPHSIGRQTTVKYGQREPDINQNIGNQQAYLEQQIIKRHQIETPKNIGWIDNLSKCLTYPERRFYILPEMHSRRKF